MRTSRSDMRPRYSGWGAPLLVGWALLVAVDTQQQLRAQERSDAELASDADAGADATATTETLVVTATRLPVPIEDTGRSVEVLTRAEIEGQAVRSVPELLQLLPGLDVRRRGPFGTQADLSARGGSFEETLILLDGVPFTNPQTGHHNLDLPVPTSAIERVETLYGPGSALYGANATGAVVQILTRAPAPGLTAEAEVFAGEHSLSGGSFSLSARPRSRKAGGHRLSAERNESAGHRAGTEFDQHAVHYAGSFGGGDAESPGSSTTRLFAGWNERDFGAFEFYSTRFPHQEERTAGAFGAVRFTDQALGGEVIVGGAWRKHRDRFILDRFQPAFSQNLHSDSSLEAEASFRRATAWGDLEFGAGTRDESLDSSNLGRQDRHRTGAFAAYASRQRGASVRAAIHADRAESGTATDWQVHPALALSLPAGERTTFRFAVASAYRLPSFTELYYRDPATAGNPGLEPEHSWTYEAGLAWHSADAQPTHVDVTVFRRSGRELIDFVQAPGDTLFRAVNLRDVETDGVEFVVRRSFGAPTGRFDAVLSYHALDASGAEPEGISRYVFDYLAQRAALRITAAGPAGSTLGVVGSWNERHRQEAYVRLDARLSVPLPRGGFSLHLDGTNLTGERIIELSRIEMPGRWLVAGLRWSVR